MREYRSSTVRDDDPWARLEELGRAQGRPRPGGSRQTRGQRAVRRRRRFVRVMAVVLSLSLVLVAAGAFLGWRYVGSLLERGQQPVRNLTASDPGEPMNILLVGSDSREGLSEAERRRLGVGSTGGRRTDTIMVVHVSPERKKAVMMSIPRDLQVEIPGHGTAKINAAFSLGGPDLLVQTIQEALGLHIHHYVEVSFAGFLEVVDAVGGVELCNRSGHPLVDPTAGLNMPEGCHTMKGKQALAYVRARKSVVDEHGRDDFGRMGRQQEFIRALMKKVMAGGNLINIPKMTGIASDVADSVITDEGFGVRDALGLARKMGNLSPESVDMRILPAAPIDNSYVGMLPEARVLIEAIEQDVQKLPPVGLPGKSTESLLQQTSVTVLNGGDVQGAAGRLAEALQAWGIDAEAANAPAPIKERAVLAYPKDGKQQAELLAYILGDGVKLEQAAPDQGSGLTLTIGPSFEPPPGATTAGTG